MPPPEKDGPTERNARLAAIEAESALLHAMRASALQIEVAVREKQIGIIRASTSWKLTAPMRGAVHLARRSLFFGTVFLRSLRKRGPAGTLRRMVLYRPAKPHRPPRGMANTGAAARLAVQAVYDAPLADPADQVLAPRILIIAELSIPQCAKYRVWQKQEHLERLGTACTVLDWRRIAACRSAMQIAARVIFYRVPATKETLTLIDEAKRLNVTTFWEADDLIFDVDLYKTNRNLATLTEELRAEVMRGVSQYRSMMLACDRTIASTEALAGLMQQMGAGLSLVIENSLDAETLSTAAALRATPRVPDGTVIITYGSGTKTHDIDFQEVAPALITLMRTRPEIRLRIIGELTLPDAMDAFADRIERFESTGYRAYLGLLNDSDIAIAPLEDTVFNDAKSNIKFIEAAILGLPSVCSPRVNFRHVVEDGLNGFLAADTAGWLAALTALADDAALRQRMGGAALRTVLDRYVPELVAQRQVSRLVADLGPRPRPRLRVLVVNIFFAPQSFGGATIVAEQMAQRLDAMAGVDVFVMAAHSRDASPQYTFSRYRNGSVSVIGISPPHSQDLITNFDNPEMAVMFRDVLAAVEPDVVHFHSLQSLSASIVRTCEEAGIPYVVTVHDAWWLCQRQFMVRADNTYCFQTTIDVTMCEACIPSDLHLRHRLRILLETLRGAAFVLSPSESHRRLYLANGIDRQRLLVNRNGFRHPSMPRQRRASRVLRFGYVGGNEKLKGIGLIRDAFAEVTASNYELVMVDNTLNLGFASLDVRAWKLRGRVEIVPAYTQDGLDAFFEGLDVLLFPSQWKESFGLTVAEALARDVWVIATDGGGAAELITDGVNGTLISLRNDPAPLQAAIEALLAAPERLAGYRNPLKAELPTYEAQAAQLYAILATAAGQPVETIDAAPDEPGERAEGSAAIGADEHPVSGLVGQT